jgi:uncharacterized protein with PhoU and TrkA domain
MVGHVRGGLAQVAILSSMLFAGISGSAVAGASAIGQSLSALPLEGCSVSALVRGGRRRLEWPADLAVEAGDTLVLSGTVEQVGSAEARLLRMGAPGRS